MFLLCSCLKSFLTRANRYGQLAVDNISVNFTKVEVLLIESKAAIFINSLISREIFIIIEVLSKKFTC